MAARVNAQLELRRLRDDAKICAISFQRVLRSKRILDSQLVEIPDIAKTRKSLPDEIPGIGKARNILLLKTFGSVSAMRKLRS